MRKTPNFVSGIGALQRRRQAQRQHAARVGRVDDAVVPQARGGVVGVALRLVLLADRRLEGFFLLGASTAPPLASMPSRLTVASTLAACSPPITLMRALGHIHRKRGE